MTSKDAIDGAGDRALWVDPNWPGLDGSPGAEFSASKMRAIATELEEYAGMLKGPAYSEGYTTGTVESVGESAGLTAKEIGSWSAAQAFAHTVGQSSGDEGAQALWKVYGLFAQRLDEAVKAIRANADEYDGARQANGG
ncbi:hypothetical protein [Streptosporangium pseudovulgare]|uniref:PE domain-containing protein n=1 Tax=Streptosporangium pseudovulgare TaxID=35765 RepID=A0ABQ2QXM6_9ACTN|nr:hypothetical protein [Streptosporangium pseudovulgare]GGQ02638.1 hypothetical protein GCM10010140_36050 [Streptosporangium pseudovulgare]